MERGPRHGQAPRGSDYPVALQSILANSGSDTAALLKAAIELYPAASSKPSLAPGLRGVVHVLGHILGASPATVTEALAAVPRCGVMRDGSPDPGREPIAVFLHRAATNGPAGPPVAPERLRRIGPQVLALAQRICETEEDAAADLLFELNILLADPEAPPTGKGLQQAFERRSAKFSAATRNIHAPVTELLAHYLDERIKIERLVVGRSTKQSSREEQERRRADRRFMERLEPTSRTGSRADGEPARHPRWPVQVAARERLLNPRRGPTPQHAAYLMASASVVATAEGQIVASPEDLAAFMAVAGPVLYLCAEPDKAHLRGALLDDGGDRGGAELLLVPLAKNVIDKLDLRAFDESAGSTTCRPKTGNLAPFAEMATVGVQTLDLLEGRLWRTALRSPRPDARTQILRKKFHGTPTGPAALRKLGRALMLHAGLEPCEICLLGGPTDPQDDSQLAYETMPAAVLARRAAAARRRIAQVLVSSLPPDLQRDLHEQRHVLDVLANDQSGPLFELPASLGCGSRWSVHGDQVQQVVASLRSHPLPGPGPALHDFLVLCLAFDLLVNYGLRDFNLRLEKDDHLRLGGQLYVWGKAGTAGRVDGRLPLAPETAQLFGRLQALRSLLELGPGGLLRLAGEAEEVDATNLFEHLHRTTGFDYSEIPVSSLRKDVNRRLRDAGIDEWRRRAILLHYDPVALPYQPWSDQKPAALRLDEALASVRIPLGLADATA